MKTIFITRPIPELGLAMLRDKGYEVDLNDTEAIPTQDDLIAKLSKKPYDAVVTLLTDKIDAKIFDAVPSAKIFANMAIGYDNLDLVEAKKRGIVVTNTPGNYGYAIAEHTMALILGLTTRMVEADGYVRAGKYKGWAPNHFVGTDLKGMTVGLIGVGNIGESVAKHLFHGFDSKVIYYDVNPNERVEKECGATRVSSIEELLKQSDIVSLHVPLLPSTKHLMNEARLKLMKPTAFLINTARGPVVDEKALVAALKAGVIKGAGLDVYEFEPNVSPELFTMPNVILTPHIASSREKARNQMAALAAENIIDLFEGRVPRSIVNA